MAYKVPLCCETANNLSDVASVATARTNLGLGTAATHASTDYLLVANNLSDVTRLVAMTNLGSVGRLSTTNTINGKTAASTTVHTVTAAKSAVIYGGVIRLTTITGIVTGASGVQLNNLTAGTTIFNSIALTILTDVTQCFCFALPAIAYFGRATAGDVIQFQITGGYNATTATLSFDLLGYEF